VGGLDELWAEFKRLEEAKDVSGLRLYRHHVSDQLLAWTTSSSERARSAVESGRSDDAVSAIDDMALGARQLYRIARQEGARPDYSQVHARPSSL
jgi:hypothetical protein